MKYHLIYLAAGNSRRFKTNKLFHLFEGKPLYLHGLDTLHAFAMEQLHTDLRIVSQYEEILKEGERRKIPSIYSPNSCKGLSYTIKAAIESIQEIGEEEYLLFAVADQPFLSKHTLRLLLDEGEKGVEAASVRYNGRPGSPTLFHRSLIPELLCLKEDEGGRKVLKQHTCVYVDVEDGRELFDIDTPEYELELEKHYVRK